MSYDHKPEDEVELARIKNAGGKVTMDGRVNGGLNLSRAIGMTDLYFDWSCIDYINSKSLNDYFLFFCKHLQVSPNKLSTCTLTLR